MMAPTTQLLGAAILFCTLVLASSRDLRRRSMIEEVADGCRIGKTTHYTCCFECYTCAENGVDAPSCRGRREMDYWDTKRETEDYWMERRLAEILDTKREAADYWEDKRDVDYWQEKRAPKCRVRVEEGMHKCCVRRNGCACPKGVYARCG